MQIRSKQYDAVHNRFMFVFIIAINADGSNWNETNEWNYLLNNCLTFASNNHNIYGVLKPTPKTT